MPPLTGQTCVITGANRGIGLQFVKQLLAKGNRVIAACRQPSQAQELQGLSNVELTQLDITSPESVEAWAASVRELTPHVDLLVNNAGAYGRRVGFSEVTPQDFTFAFTVNAIGPMLVVQELHRAGLLGGEQPSLVANVTSKMGSIDDNTSGGAYAYRASKVSLNIISKSLSIDLAPANVTTTLLHPGYVMTDMTGGKGLIDTETSVSGMLAVLERPLSELQGTWHAFDGKPIPW